MSLQDPQGSEPTPPTGPGTPPQGRSALLILLAVALVASLAANAALGVKVRHQRTTTGTLEQQIQALNEQLDLLRARVSGSGSGSSCSRRLCSFSNVLMTTNTDAAMIRKFSSAVRKEP